MNKMTISSSVTANHGLKSLETGHDLSRRLSGKLSAAIVAAIFVVAGPVAHADPFPDRPVKIVVGFAPGSGIDSASRLFARELSDKLGVQVYVENKPGASGAIAARQVRQSSHDGYTILATGMSHSVINPIVMKDPGYDVANDFRVIAGMIKAPFGVVVPDGSPFLSIADLAKRARGAEPGLVAGSYSAGYELYTRWFGQEIGASFNIIPYKGASAQLTDLIAGRLDFGIMDISSVESLVKSRDLKLLAVTSTERLDNFPDVPTLREAGYPQYVGYATVTLSVDSRTQSDIIQKLSNAAQQVSRSEAVKTFASSTGVLPLTDTPDLLEARQKAELEALGKIARNTGFHPE